MVFGFDLDGCVINIEPILLKVAADMYGITQNTISDWGLGLESKEAVDKVVDTTLDLWTDYFPYAGSIEFIEEYYKRTWNDVYFVTARPKIANVVTLNWLQSYLDPHIIYKLIHSHDKVSVMDKFHITHFVEDRPENIELLVAHGIQVFMPNRKWNEHYNNEQVIKFNSWQELYSHIPQRSSLWEK